MLVLDDLYVSKEVLSYLEESQEPVLATDAALSLAKTHKLNVCADDASVAQALAANPRIIAFSEMNLEDVKHIASEQLIRAIDLCKDKAANRRVLAPLFPDYTFSEYSLEELLALDPAGITFPVVIKPSVGFFSLGIYPVFSSADWVQAIADIKKNSDSWDTNFNTTVINDNKFLVESYLEGEEYAIDVYFDSEGKAVVLNILKHDFAGDQDVTDHLYYSSKRVIETQLEAMTGFLDKANTLLGFHDFPVHVEARVQKNGQIIPIEFNPLRFAGLCTTDISYFAYGFKTYEYFLNNRRPDWGTLLAEKEDLIYSLILLTMEGFDAQKPYSFDYETFVKRFKKVLDFRKTDYAHMGSFGFLFTETRTEDFKTELIPMLNLDLGEYLTYY